MRRIAAARLAVAIGASAIATAVCAQSAGELAMDESRDRPARLEAGAKKEGTLTFYTSLAEKDLGTFTAAFEKRYGIKVNTWRASSVKVLQRVTAEAAANRFDVDAIEISSPELEALYREKLLQEVRSRYFDDLVPGALPAHRAWVAHYLSVFVQAYNTNQVKKDELPKSYSDLLAPKWKGRLGVEANDQEWFCTLTRLMGGEQGHALFREIALKNGFSVRQGHTLLNNLVVSGEVPLALTLYSYMPAQAKQQGAPIDWFVLEPVIGRSNGIAVTKRAPHPHAALLWYEYMISEAQAQLVKLNYVPVNRNFESPFKGRAIHFVDAAEMLDEKDRCTKRYEQALAGRG